MCINLKRMYICKNPYNVYGNFVICTRQYNEYCQYDKEYVFFENSHYIKRFKNVEMVYVPCGKCFTCLTKRSKAWTLRLSTEYIKYKDNCVLTLTYDNEHLPENGLLQYKDVQLFLKRLRKKYKDRKIRFACSCEYGGLRLRPHYHIILFNWFPPDLDVRYPYKKTKKGTKLYKSEICNQLWSNGFVDVGLVDYHTSRYITQYCVKKAAHKDYEAYVEKNKIKREQLVCSVGTGLDYFLQNYKTIFSQCFCSFGALKYPIPKYFKNKCKQLYESVYNSYKDLIKISLQNFVLDHETQLRFEAVEERLRRVFLKFHDNLYDDHVDNGSYIIYNPAMS